MTAQQEASVADERVEAIAQIIEEEAIDLTAGSGEIEGVGRMSRRAAIKIAALWPAPAEDEAAFQAALVAYENGIGSLADLARPAHAFLASRQPKPAHDAEPSNG